MPLAGEGLQLPHHVLRVPDHHEAAVVAADEAPAVRGEAAHGVGVAYEHGETRPALAPQPHPAVEAGGPEAEAGDGEAGDAAPALVSQQTLLDLRRAEVTEAAR